MYLSQRSDLLRGNDFPQLALPFEGILEDPPSLCLITGIENLVYLTLHRVPSLFKCTVELVSTKMSTAGHSDHPGIC